MNKRKIRFLLSDDANANREATMESSANKIYQFSALRKYEGKMSQTQEEDITTDLLSMRLRERVLLELNALHTA